MAILQGKYVRAGLFNPDKTPNQYLEMLATLPDFDDLAPGYELQRAARELAASERPMREPWDLTSEDDYLSHESLATHIVMAVAYTLSDRGETKPSMVETNLTRRIRDTREARFSAKKTTAISLSEKDLMLSTGDRIRIVLHDYLLASDGKRESHAMGWYREFDHRESAHRKSNYFDICLILADRDTLMADVVELCSS